jgi:citrate synthase
MNEVQQLDELLASRRDQTRRPVQPCTVVIFGASGDLTARKLIPALYHLAVEKLMPRPFRIVGFARREKTDESWREELHEALVKFSRTTPVNEDVWAEFASNIHYCQADISDAAQRRKALRIFAKAPSAVAAAHRLSKGMEPIAPDAALPFCENFFQMVFGRVPAKEVIKAFDVSMILYAEHTFNASTFAARTVASTMADMHAAVTAGIAALKGPLHGGANEAVMHMLREIPSPDVAEAWLRERFDHKALVMGFGHRVYKNGDSRVPTMKKYAEVMAEVVGDKRWMNTSAVLARVMLEEKRIHPNLDFPAGPAYYLMGFDIPMFTPIFVCSRITGWTAHVLEQLADNRLIRPLSLYTGHEQRAVPAMAAR